MSTQEFRQQMLPLWEQMIANIFPVAMPSSASWTCHQDMVAVLNHVGATKDLNHLFFPRGGGLDLTGASISLDSGCIDLNFGRGASIAKANRLSCEIFPDNMEFSYFRIDCDDLAPSGVCDELAFDHEELVQLDDGTYLDRSLWDRGYMSHDPDGNEIPFPGTARIVTRHIKGSFVIFCKASAYNADSSTYDGRHSKMSAPDFRTYIEKSASPAVV
ncbi:hypothetical protein [Roseimaritima sediminicola]|uniref:hypothetical protein n=1 Tax=Roseimaritima sediminicola TaxID=2662066 RepID=UPI001298584F|nr:hypothetical protein [Roseimaritima sediminicola]